MTDRAVVALLQRATEDLVSAPGGGAAALERAAAIRRRRRRAGAVGVAAAGVVAAVLMPVALVDPGDDARPAPAPVTQDTDGPPPSAEDLPLEVEQPDPADHPRWDPFTLTDAPRTPSPLPETITPPEAAPSIVGASLDRVLLALPREGRDLLLLGDAGQWRSVPDTADALAETLAPTVSPAITADGTRVAMSMPDGVLVVDPAAGATTLLPWPEAIAAPSDTAPELRWLPGDEGLIVEHWKGPWIISLDGRAEPAPWTDTYGGTVFADPAGTLRQWDFEDSTLTRLEDDGSSAGSARLPWWGSRFVAGEELIGFVGSAGTNPPEVGPFVVRPATGELVGWLRVRDRNGEYTDNGYLNPIGFPDPGSLLLHVGPMDFGSMESGEESWYVASWDLDSDAVTVLTEGDSELARAVVAVDAVG